MSYCLPTPAEVRQDYFGKSDNEECAQIMLERERQSSHLELSNQTVDLSLFPYQLEGICEPPIPTPAEIAAARADDNDAVPNQAWRVGPYMAKVGHHIGILQEAENLLYLERNSCVRTPKVYAAFASRDADPYNMNARRLDFKEGDENLVAYYIVMEFIEGDTLDALSEELEDNSRVARKIGRQLGEQLRRLRSVPAEDSTHFGRVKGKAYSHLSIFYHPPSPDFGNYGPFNYEQCVERLIHAAKVDMALGYPKEDFSPLPKLLFRDAASAFLDHARPNDRLPVLSHLDTQGHNIIVKIIRDDKGKAVDVDEVVLIDWATLCWMPPWYEAGDICRNMSVPNEFFAIVGEETFKFMGHVNTVIAAFLALCVNRAFFLVHM